MKTFKNVSPDWGDYTEVTPADYRKQAEIFGIDVKVTSDNEGIYADGVKVAEPIKETPLDERERLNAAAPDMLQALKDALQICGIAKQYFPKSIKAPAKFALLNVEANSIRKAIEKATGVYPL